ncbi:signal peptide peptidase SppA [Microvirga terricola]|uniref:Signal peptide peptidase SppA n=1 Tax=Microvirga terricola TaxID=2719797 RepID=A0ABX0VAL7_9HYPH|nr:signal peptide peptidase SppA [Microvirga terricola]NIX75735.1 signal peptide peptidase SppA [Microvirga terricola]
MSVDAEVIADRRRLRRKLTFWRVTGLLGLIAAIVALGYLGANRSGLVPGQEHVARISINGFITSSQRLANLMDRVGRAPNVAGVVISVNSPGGTTTGSEELFRNIRRLADKKPVVTFVEGTAASGGYITAIASDHIVARETAIVGSIGVLFQYPDVSQLLTNWGVKVEAVKSSPLKAEPSGFNPTSPEARAALQEVVNDTFGWFKGLVRERRHLTDAELAAASTGQVFSGRQGVPLKLVDSLGTERDAIAWLEREKGVRKNLPVQDWRPSGSREIPLLAVAASGADLVGLTGVAEALRRTSAVADQAQLDGLLVVWHPSEK